MFNADEFSLVSSLANADTPNIYSYYSGTDTIDQILASGYFAAANGSAYITSNADITSLVKAGDKLIVVDASGNTYELFFVNTSGTITLISTTKVLLQNKVSGISTAQTIYDLPPRGVITKIQAILDAAITVANTTVTIMQGANTIATITIATTDAAGAIYTPTLTATAAFLKFDGSTPLKMVAAGGSTGASNLKILTSMVASAN